MCAQRALLTSPIWERSTREAPSGEGLLPIDRSDLPLPNGERECSLHFWKSARSREFAHSIRPCPRVGLAEHGKNAALHFGDAVAPDLEVGFVSAAVVGVVDST